MENMEKQLGFRERELDTFIERLLACAKLNDHYPNFPKSDACRAAVEFLHEAKRNIFMAIQALAGAR